MLPTEARLSAQPAIVKIRRVAALIILLPAATPATTRLYAFTALLLLVERADQYGRRAVMRSPLPPVRVRLAADTRSPLHSRSFIFSKRQGETDKTVCP